MLISLEQARDHLRAQDSDDDADLTLKISAAQLLAQEYVGRQIFATQPELDAAVLAGTAGTAPMVCNDLVRAALLLILGHFYANREDVVVGTISTALDMGSRDLLATYRVGMGV